MKKVIISILISLCSAYIANAQVGGIEYQSIYSGQQSNSGQSHYQSQPQGQIMRTTAYYMDSSNRPVKMPIKVNITSSRGGYVQLKVVEQYVSYGIGGEWQKTTPTYVSQCISMYASNPLEQQFMYKAMIGGKWCYFDL